MRVEAGVMPKFRPANASVSLVALACAIALLYFGRSFLITLITAVVIAFILEPFVMLLMRLRLPRAVASVIVCSFAICVVYLAGLGVYTQAAGLVEDLPKYALRINDITDQVVAKLEGMERAAYEIVVPKRFREQQAQPAQPVKPPEPVTRRGRRTPEPPMPVPAPPPVQEVRIRPEHPPAIDFIYTHFGSVYEIVLLASFIPFLVYFMLSWREHIYVTFLQFFEDNGRVAAAKSVDRIAAVVRAFVTGNFVLGILLAILSTVVFWVFKLPYPLLVGPMSGFLSLVPYIGLPLAMLPPFVSALAVYTGMAQFILMLSIVAVLHLIAMNLLYPKIVGPRVHLNPLAVTVALMFWSVIWGAPGLILAIPLTAGLKAVCDNVEQLQPYGRFLGD
jgi:predicted PurR-regulated permease PerM